MFRILRLVALLVCLSTPVHAEEDTIALAFEDFMKDGEAIVSDHMDDRKSLREVIEDVADLILNPYS